MLALVATAAVVCWFAGIAGGAYLDYRYPHRVEDPGRPGVMIRASEADFLLDYRARFPEHSRKWAEVHGPKSKSPNVPGVGTPQQPPGSAAIADASARSNGPGAVPEASALSVSR